MAGEAVGKIDADPGRAEAAVGERGTARVGFGIEGGGAGVRQPVHGMALLYREQRGAPVLRGGLEQ